MPAPLLFLALAHQTPTDTAAVVKEKPQESAAAVPATRPPFAQEAQGTLGALFASGNVQSAAAKVGGFYGLRAGDHGVRVDLGLGLAALAVDGDGDPANGFTRVDETGADVGEANLLDNTNTSGFGRLRYDYFLGEVGSVYAAGLGFHDSAARLLARLRVDVGYRHFLFQAPKHALSAEVGAVYTIDNAIFNTENADTSGDGKLSVWDDETEFEESGGVVGARIALSYSNALLDNVSFTQTLEAVPNLSFGPDVPVFGDVDAPFESLRSADGAGDDRLGLGEATIVNSATQLTVNVDANLAIGFNLTIVHDNGAIARRNAYTNTDVAAALQLSYKLF